MLQEVQSIIAQFERQVSTAMPQWTQARDPAAFIDAELDAHQAVRQLADGLVAIVLRQILGDDEFATGCVAKAAATGRYRRKPIADTLWRSWGIVAFSTPALSQ